MTAKYNSVIHPHLEYLSEGSPQTIVVKAEVTSKVLHFRVYTYTHTHTHSHYSIYMHDCTYVERGFDVCSKLLHISELDINHFSCLVENTGRDVSGYLCLQISPLHHNDIITINIQYATYSVHV